jgi:hypothetical protein
MEQEASACVDLVIITVMLAVIIIVVTIIWPESNAGGGFIFLPAWLDEQCVKSFLFGVGNFYIPTRDVVPCL